jgi:glycosyltransferase involved in cell wall biosynthesis
MDNSNSIGLLIPAYNVEKYLPALLDEALKYFEAGNILVVNDGSSDNTGKIVRDYDIELVSHEKNLGKGAALKSGFDYLISRGADWIITIDGDMQHDPALLPQFIEYAEQGSFDLVIGARKRNFSDMPWDRRFSNWSTSTLMSLITGENIKDGQCGYRLIRCSKLADIVYVTNGYEFETECLLKMLHSGAKIAWIDIPTNYSGAPSSIKRLRDIVRFLKVIVRFVVERKKI